MKPKTKPAAKRKASVQPITEFTKDFDKCAAVAASKLDLNNLALEERAFLGTCQDIYRNHTGCYTPFESFFLGLVRWTMWGNTPTLEILRAELEENGDGEFVHDWNSMFHGMKRFIQNYPSLIAHLQNAAKGEAEQPAEAAHA